MVLSSILTGSSHRLPQAQPYFFCVPKMVRVPRQISTFVNRLDMTLLVVVAVWCPASCLTRPGSSLAAIPASWHATSCSQFLLVRPALLYNSFSLLWLFLQKFSYIFTIHSGRYWCNIVRPTPYESQVNRFPLLFLPPPWFPVAYAVRWCLQFQTNRSGADLWLDYSL